MLEPITLPSAISTSSFLAATIEVTNSGRLVPSATIVRPISVWLKPNPAAIADAPSTTKSPPNFIAIIPPIIKTMHFHIGRIFISSSASASSSASSLSPAVLAFFADCIIQNRYTAKITSRITPSTRPNDIPRYPITTSRPAQRIENGNSFIDVFFSMVSGVNSAQAPQTTIRLKILDPATLLTASVLFPAMDAVTLTASSGKLVPIATIVIPMIKDGTLNFFATEELPSTK